MSEERGYRVIESCSSCVRGGYVVEEREERGEIRGEQKSGCYCGGEGSRESESAKVDEDKTKWSRKGRRASLMRFWK